MLSVHIDDRPILEGMERADRLLQRMATATKKKTFARAIGTHVIVRPNESESMTPGGIVLPDAAKEKPVSGIVVAAGSGHLTKDGQRVPLEVLEGEEVIYSSYAGHKVEVNGEELIVLNEADILVRFE